MNEPKEHRILYIHNSADIYGASRSLLRLLPRIRERGFVPFVVLPEDGPLKSRIEELSVEVIVDRWLSVINRADIRSPKLALFLLGFPISVLRLFRLIIKKRIELVHTNTGVMPSPGLAAFLAGVPHIWHVRDSFLEFRSLWKLYRIYITRLSQKVLAVSNPIADQFDGAANVIVVHNGMPLEEFPEDSFSEGSEVRIAHGIGTEPVVGCVGRIKLVRKGQETLIRAAGIVKKQGLRARYLIVGSPFPGNEDHLTELQRLVEEFDLNEEVVFTGELSDVRPAYAAMDIFVLPSAQPEPFGGVVLEAMAMKCPVIATAIGGSIDQVEDGKTGFLVAPANPKELAEKLIRLLENSALRESMGDAGRERLGRCFSMEQMLSKFEATYREVLKR